MVSWDPAVKKDWKDFEIPRRNEEPASKICKVTQNYLKFGISCNTANLLIIENNLTEN